MLAAPQPTAINVIGSSLGHGIAPHNSDNLLIENNYIGLGYDGTTILGSGNTGIGTGIALSSSHNVTIKNNRVAGWDKGGMDINSDNSDLSIENNIIHDNEANGIEISASENIQVVGNTIYNNQDVSISVFGMSLFGIVTDDVSITGNKVGLDINGTPTPNNPVGINVFGDPTNVIIGGTSPADANHIASSTGSGITTMGFDVPAMSLSGSPQKVSILGNSIYDTSPASDPSTGAGLGIDLMVGIETDSIPDGIPNTYTSSGPTPNDPTDSDTGPNNYINFPVLNSVTQDGSNATINFNLDAADSPTDQYRIEFFSNDTPDPSGYGEGQTYLGSTTVSNGNNQQTSFTLPNNINLAGKSISATTTAIDSTTNSGFGSTSEFSQIRLASVVTTPGTSQKEGLAGTGENVRMILIFAITLLTVGVVAVAGFRKKAGSSR